MRWNRHAGGLWLRVPSRRRYPASFARSAEKCRPAYFSFGSAVRRLFLQFKRLGRMSSLVCRGGLHRFCNGMDARDESAFGGLRVLDQLGIDGAGVPGLAYGSSPFRPVLLSGSCVRAFRPSVSPSRSSPLPAVPPSCEVRGALAQISARTRREHDPGRSNRGSGDRPLLDLHRACCGVRNLRAKGLVGCGVLAGVLQHRAQRLPGPAVAVRACSRRPVV
jgi:hypothetical protein